MIGSERLYWLAYWSCHVTVRKQSHFIGGRNSVFRMQILSGLHFYCFIWIIVQLSCLAILFGNEKKADYFGCDVRLIVFSLNGDFLPLLLLPCLKVFANLAKVYDEPWHICIAPITLFRLRSLRWDWTCSKNCLFRSKRLKSNYEQLHSCFNMQIWDCKSTPLTLNNWIAEIWKAVAHLIVWTWHVGTFRAQIMTNDNFWVFWTC